MGIAYLSSTGVDFLGGEGSDALCSFPWLLVVLFERFRWVPCLDYQQDPASTTLIWTLSPKMSLGFFRCIRCLPYPDSERYIFRLRSMEQVQFLAYVHWRFRWFSDACRANCVSSTITTEFVTWSADRLTWWHHWSQNDNSMLNELSSFVLNLSYDNTTTTKKGHVISNLAGLLHWPWSDSIVGSFYHQCDLHQKRSLFCSTAGL